VTTPVADLDALLEAQPEPSLIVQVDGTIDLSTKRARRINPSLRPGANLLEAAQDVARLRLFLSRCAGTRARCVGSAILLDAAGQPVRFRVQANRLNRPEDGTARLFLRLLPAVDNRFAFLAKRVRELDKEVAKRRHLQAVLEESLQQREILVREMHHRVKNNVGTLAAMLCLAADEAVNAEARSILRDAERRIQAVAAIQDVLYRSENLENAPADALVGTLVQHLQSILPRGVSLAADVGTFDVSTEQALPVALILNELTTNAVKHGFPAGASGMVKIHFSRDGARCRLAVRNPGAQFEVDPVGRKASGLGLVRGLVRQLHGTFEVTFDRGVCSAVEFEGRGSRLDS
jgi:two-component sensor histidine kinase